LSRMFSGHVFPSEREGHSLLESWHPLGMINSNYFKNKNYTN